MLDPRAASGFTSAARYYALGRPCYPEVAGDVLVRELSLHGGSVVVDLAAGTGQVAGALRAQVAAVVAVEPVAEMRAELSRLLSEVSVVGGVAESLPLAGESVDSAVVGEAFHWFDVARAAEEIARVLRRDGGLGLLWNVATWTEQDTPWLGRFRALVAHHKQAAGDYPAGDGRWRASLGGSTAEPTSAAPVRTRGATSTRSPGRVNRPIPRLPLRGVPDQRRRDDSSSRSLSLDQRPTGAR